jgi:hypothetical protein
MALRPLCKADSQSSYHAIDVLALSLLAYEVQC